MGNLTKNISRHEVACKCQCGLDSMDFETIMVVQDTCDFFALKLGLPRVHVTINSGCRCEAHNAKIGGAENSQHPKCRAIDLKILEVSPADVYDYLVKRYPVQYGIGKYNSFTHIDTRTDGPARW
jgi:uncharacterized protein YcbK (DUF882 family)